MPPCHRLTLYGHPCDHSPQLTPVSVPLGKGTGQVKVFDLKAAAEGNMEPVYTMNVAEGASAVSLVWQPNIQQVAVRNAAGRA